VETGQQILGTVKIDTAAKGDTKDLEPPLARLSRKKSL